MTTEQITNEVTFEGKLQELLYKIEMRDLKVYEIETKKVYRRREKWCAKIELYHDVIVVNNFEDLQKIVTYPHDWEWLSNLDILNKMHSENCICNNSPEYDTIAEINQIRGY